MTKAEYQKLYRQARNDYPKILRQAMIQLKKVYTTASDAVAAEVLKAELGGLSDLTVESWASIDDQLRVAIKNLDEALKAATTSSVVKGSEIGSRINERQLTDALTVAGADQALKAGVRSMYRTINESVVQNLVGRIYQNGYTFSETVWNIAKNYEETIKDIISAGIAQGRPVEQIAKDIQVYTNDGKVALANRYGRLERGTREFMQRIGSRVDWRALRLVRTELYTSIREASREQGHANPGSTDEYDWILEAGRQQWACDCPDLAAGSPYKYQDVPGTPHPNCSCYILPVLRDANDFTRDLKTWLGGGDVDYLDDWYRDKYLPLQNPVNLARWDYKPREIRNMRKLASSNKIMGLRRLRIGGKL
jgi:hypothetical protein